MTEDVVTIRLPKLGESIVSAKVVQWLKKEGDHVAEDEPLLEVATDKVNSEIPSPVEGVLGKILAQPDDEVDVGGPLATLRPIGTVDLEAEATVEPKYESHPEHHEATKGFLSPAVLRLMRERGIPLEELDKIRGTGHGGRVTKRDVEAYVVASWEKPPTHGDVERVPMGAMRKAIADNMTRSFYTAPHAYLITEIDVTDTMASIRGHREAFMQEHGVKLTITSFVVKAIADAVQECPLVNASIEEETIIVKKDVNVGIAVAIDDGLVVPVLKETQSKGIPDIAMGIADLSKRARSRKLEPDQVTGGSITLTNFGMAGAMVGLPIIRYPEVAIIGLGAIQKRVVPDGDGFAVRDIVHATLSLDHRALDGMYAGQFLAAFKSSLESTRLPD